MKFRITLFKLLIAYIAALSLTCQAQLASDTKSTTQETQLHKKLDLARIYAEEFLKEDARPGQQFFVRTPKFPTHKGQPINDCDIYAIVRSIETRYPYFENKQKTIVAVPVWAELIMLNVPSYAGFPFGINEAGEIQCRFEYQKYSLKEKKFLRTPDILKKPYAQTFKTWGEAMPSFDADQGGYIAINPENRYVQFIFRVSVANNKVSQLYPQFPRHHLAGDSIRKLEEIAKEVDEGLINGVSTRDSSLTGLELQADLIRMKKQNEARKWALLKMNQSLNLIKSISPFSEINN